MKLSARQFSPSAILKNSLKVILLAGEDEGLLSLKSQLLLKAFQDKFSIQTYSSSEILEKPELILGQQDLFSSPSKKESPSLYYLQHVGSSFKVLSETFSAKKDSDLLLLEAPSLSRTSALYKACEKSSVAVSVPFYEATDYDRSILLTQYFPDIDTPSKDILLSFLTPNLSLASQELAQLSLFCKNPKNLSVELIEKCFVSRETSQELEFSEALAQKNFSQIFKSYIQATHIEKVGLIRKSLYHFIRLNTVKSQLEKNIPYSIALKRLTPPLFFKQATMFEKCMKIWSSSQLLKAVALLKKAELLTKQQPEVDLTPLLYQLTKITC
ncbi:MAG: hypothetical protein GY915_09765 [bacterium]|nr:hypothetical protein [bacterium]